MKKLLYLLILLALPNAAFAFGPGQPYAGLGFFFQNMFKVTDSPTAAKSPFGEVYVPELVLGYKLPLVFPSLAWTILGKKIDDGEKRRSVIRLDVPFLFPLSEVELKGGLGILLSRVHGDASTVTLRNGGSTSDFYVPEGSRASRLFYLVAGAAYTLRAPLRFDLDLIVTGPLSKRRSLNISLRGGYVF